MVVVKRWGFLGWDAVGMWLGWGLEGVVWWWGGGRAWVEDIQVEVWKGICGWGEDGGVVICETWGLMDRWGKYGVGLVLARYVKNCVRCI